VRARKGMILCRIFLTPKMTARMVTITNTAAPTDIPMIAGTGSKSPSPAIALLGALPHLVAVSTGRKTKNS
jgi:hypothetical protein